MHSKNLIAQSIVAMICMVSSPAQSQPGLKSQNEPESEATSVIEDTMDTMVSPDSGVNSGWGEPGETLEALITRLMENREPLPTLPALASNNNLLKEGIKARLSKSLLIYILHPNRGKGVKPEVEDFIELLKQESMLLIRPYTGSCVAQGLPENSLAGWEEWRDSETDRGLLDYVLATEFPAQYLGYLHERGFTVHLDYLPHILQNTRRRDHIGHIIYFYKVQWGFDRLKGWRSQDGKTLYQLALFHNVPVKALDIITFHLDSEAYHSGSRAGKIRWPRYHMINYAQPGPVPSYFTSHYTMELGQLLHSQGLRQGDTEKDGECFYHVVARLFNILEEGLKAGMKSRIRAIQRALQQGGEMSEQDKVILEWIAEDKLESVWHEIDNSQWGALAWFPLAAQTLNQLTGGFSGFQVITPCVYGSDTEPLITLFQYNGMPMEVPGINPDIPIIIHDGVNHWTFAEPVPDEGGIPNDINFQGSEVEPVLINGGEPVFLPQFGAMSLGNPL